ncbi:MAG: type I 3-dehydroquinate dehydratase [Clostridia bacterium]|nr:type I 3-dehydroquinate dehydratase [Clostridia bacterium]
MKTFLHTQKPMLVGMLRSTTKAELLAEIKSLRAQGADAYGFQLESMEPEMRTRESLAEVFAEMDDLPVYATNYMRANKEEKTWDELAEEMIMLAELGATIIDIPGDMFASAEFELTYDKEAIAKQKALIDRLHAMGKEVLISSHALAPFTSEAVLTFAREHVARGADVSKIVTVANTEAEEDEAFRSLALLKQTGIPFLYLVVGERQRKHRVFGPVLGCSLYLCTEHKEEVAQPPIAEAKAILDYYE